MELLVFVLTTTYFQFKGKNFRQKFGAAMGSPVSPIVANLFMEHLEQAAIATAPMDCRPKFWKRYVDDILDIVKKDKTSTLNEHLNTIDSTVSIKFTYEEETEGSIPFLDTLIVRKADGTVKLLVYRKKTHTDQYLNFSSHHPLHQKLGVVRTLLDRCGNLVTEEQDRIQEQNKVQDALKVCGYPKWTFEKVKEQIRTKQAKPKTKPKDYENKSKGMVVLPYVQGLSEGLARVFKKHNIHTALKPHCTLRNLLVHPKDKRDQMDCSGVVYRVGCNNCSHAYIGETGRNLGYRIDEHKKNVTQICDNKKYTRAERKTSEKEWNHSAITDHVAKENHVIDWDNIKIVDRESLDQVRRIRESICIRKEQHPMNRDEGGHRLSHLYDIVLAAPSSGKNHF